MNLSPLFNGISEVEKDCLVRMHHKNLMNILFMKENAAYCIFDNKEEKPYISCIIWERQAQLHYKILIGKQYVESHPEDKIIRVVLDKTKK
ncbi:hypothetical protein [Paenibacillus aquistagni]|uniref:hypothetical protein n=1 Tax=Paenibacillus aquistagni TaxID=1852522 RepID=UPI00145B0D1E|nr:hypothetical protein [Paenibacillus aquistagni]NMM55572.1 hypothetical protein [Paenibacillus aquistagni]